MKNSTRDNPLFSLCGLNCGLCQMYVGHYCPGCGGEGKGSCSIMRCSTAHGNVPYCYLCPEYPCAQYVGFAKYDSILPTRNRAQDIARAKEAGIDAYMAALREKMALLDTLLTHYNDGRRKSLFLTAVYLLDLADVKSVVAALPPLDVPLKERGAAAAAAFAAVAAERGIDLKLHKKPKQDNKEEHV